MYLMPLPRLSLARVSTWRFACLCHVTLRNVHGLSVRTAQVSSISMVPGLYSNTLIHECDAPSTSGKFQSSSNQEGSFFFR